MLSLQVKLLAYLLLLFHAGSRLFDVQNLNVLLDHRTIAGNHTLVHASIFGESKQIFAAPTKISMYVIVIPILSYELGNFRLGRFKYENSG